ncbi:hypothetical protein [Domibacillus robiginosus]|uniref:hypothetical protein n=1 Tax=Domibacillus robiginosus TaxID=1071054 RepID=UPI00067CF7F9|nr:hypothetical protein [Domibacillus robiginosus]
MTEEETESIFGVYGHGKMFEKLQYPLNVSGELDDEHPDILESFFDWCDFEEGTIFHFNEFKVHFRIFKMLYDRDILPSIY